MKYTITIPMRPVAKARPRVTSTGAYTPARMAKAEDDIAKHWLLAKHVRFGSRIVAIGGSVV